MVQTTVGTTLNATATVATGNPGILCDEAAATTANSTSITQKTLTNTTSAMEKATSTNNNEHRSSSTYVAPNIQSVYNGSSATQSPPKRISKKCLPTHGEITEAHTKVHLGMLHHANQQLVELARNYEVKLDGKVVQRFQQQIGVAYSRDSSQEMH